ncbi:MAG: C_GCAxxG_C_C family protein [Deltaproteobacteria bacterium]|nr:C_GCAxxG_C_C family protein [Deltaproteobacteria bacterium]
MTKANKEISSFKTARTFMKEGTCSEAVMNVLDRAYGYPLEAEEHAVMPLAGGIVQQGYQCGMLWGACLAAGAQAYRLFGATPKAEAAAIRASRRLVESLGAREGNINCLEITDTDWTNKWQAAKFLLKGGGISCMRRVVGFAPEAFRVINDALAEPDIEEPSSPVSCAAELARKMGASKMHVVMAAGLAGGIGFSGSGCGALGAAIWITGMNNPDEKTGFTADGTKVGEAIDRFLEAAGHEYECSEIVGRKFESVDDHAGYVYSGGCSNIIEALVGFDVEQKCQESAA